MSLGRSSALSIVFLSLTTLDSRAARQQLESTPIKGEPRLSFAMLVPENPEDEEEVAEYEYDSMERVKNWFLVNEDNRVLPALARRLFRSSKLLHRTKGVASDEAIVLAGQATHRLWIAAFDRSTAKAKINYEHCELAKSSYGSAWHLGDGYFISNHHCIGLLDKEKPELCRKRLFWMLRAAGSLIPHGCQEHIEVEPVAIPEQLRTTLVEQYGRAYKKGFLGAPANHEYVGPEDVILFRPVSRKGALWHRNERRKVKSAWFQLSMPVYPETEVGKPLSIFGVNGELSQENVEEIYPELKNSVEIRSLIASLCPGEISMTTGPIMVSGKRHAVDGYVRLQAGGWVGSSGSVVTVLRDGKYLAVGLKRAFNRFSIRTEEDGQVRRRITLDSGTELWTWNNHVLRDFMLSIAQEFLSPSLRQEIENALPAGQ